ncbi:hypothetical protein [Pseudobacteroides cellulosolvens]|uniref:Uncharacterized protein n=1 Tax=Pseudobacteroides cellulosolvens ATCC 35603 = DSM 2933 TaxID=398512 RepID=A0A0L6JJG8_9FIRM|nr:hypothetical protein [Pseudobacteroides cellulosolvens]KNY25899.1 hypothetical protein Bccel_1159 [Pseudobacteroides cellulosolvens ATCC 35603 = DSM 2933]
MDELTRYIFNSYSNLMTIQENMAWRYFLFKANGQMDSAKSLESNIHISALIILGEDGFYSYVKDRILKEHSDVIIFNYCPKCRSLTRTPRAKQCLKCKYNWH